LTSKRPQRIERQRRHARESVAEARRAVEQVTESEAEDLDVDPASSLFFEFAAPLLLTARTEQEFEAASALADFVWAATHFDAQTQVLMLDEFIREGGMAPEMVPWLLEVYGELAARKAALLGE
jgi:hypothetical protein